MAFLKKIKIVCLLLFMQALCKIVPAQDIHFSPFFETHLLRNPSLAGIYTGDIRVQAVYRDQWNSVTNAYRTGSLNAEYKMPVGKSNDFMTAGMEILYDKAGTIGWTTTQLLPAFNYHKSLSNERNRYLSLGFMGGLVQQYFDRSKITTNSTYNGLGDGESLQQASFTFVDGSVGMSYNSALDDNPNNNFFIGAAYHHFNHPSNSFYRSAKIQLPSKWVFSGGFKFEVTDYSYLTIQADHSIQNGSTETVAGAMYGLKLGADPDHPDYTVHAGTFLRWNDALIPVIKIDYAPFSLVFSYDVNISPLKTSSYGRGGFEMSVSYIGFLNKYKSTQNSTLCPRF